MAKVKISAPWVLFYREINALFHEDPEVHVTFDEEEKVVNLYVDNDEKASALENLIPSEKTFGEVTLKINIIPANSNRTRTINNSDDYDSAFHNNGAVSFIKKIDGVFTNKIVYVVFQREVVQYFTDDIGDYFGVESTLYENLARDVLRENPWVFFCTNVDSEADTRDWGNL